MRDLTWFTTDADSRMRREALAYLIAMSDPEATPEPAFDLATEETFGSQRDKIFEQVNELRSRLGLPTVASTDLISSIELARKEMAKLAEAMKHFQPFPESLKGGSPRQKTKNRKGNKWNGLFWKR